jgi:uncharacterized protein YegL
MSTPPCQDQKPSVRRLPVYVLIDRSAGLTDEARAGISEAVCGLMIQLWNDPWALETVWICVIAFGHSAEVVLPLQECGALQGRPLSLPVDSKAGTDLAGAMDLLAQSIEADFVQPSATAKGDYRPIAMVMLGSVPSADCTPAAERLRAVLRAGASSVLAVVAKPFLDEQEIKRVLSCDVLTLNGLLKQPAEQQLYGLIRAVVYLGDDNLVETSSVVVGSRSEPDRPSERDPVQPGNEKQELDPVIHTDCLPIYLLFDCSRSMAGEPMEATRMGLRLILNELQSDPQALETVWMSVIGFSHHATQLVPLTEVGAFVEPHLQAHDSSDARLDVALGCLLDALLEEVVPITRTSTQVFKPISIIFLGSRATPPSYDVRPFLDQGVCEDAIQRPVIILLSPKADPGELARSCEVVKARDLTPGGWAHWIRWEEQSFSEGFWASVKSREARPGPLGKLPPPPPGFPGPIIP